MSAASTCHVCGSAEISAMSRRGSLICEDCLPAQDHVVSMQTSPCGGSLAVCQCGWRSTVTGRHRYVLQDVKVRMHWRAMIGLAIQAREIEGAAS